MLRSALAASVAEDGIPELQLRPLQVRRQTSGGAAGQGTVQDQQNRLLQYYQKLAQMSKVSMLDKLSAF